MVKRRTIWLVFVFATIALGAFIYNAYKTYTFHKPIPPTFPRIEINNEGVSLDDIHKNGKDIHYSANLAIDSELLYQVVDLKGRGNSTFSEKKMPFQIKFSNKIDLYGLGRSRKWVLLANLFDDSNLRNAMAFYLERMLGEKYALNGRFVELWYNGENQGLYYLTPKVEIEKTRVDLRDPYGILVEYDALNYRNKVCYRTAQGRCLTVSDVVSEDNTEAAMQNFLKSYNDLMAAAEAGDYKTVKKLADVESLATFFLIQEFTVNPDGYASSLYLYKDGFSDKIHAGPGWDFDYAFGNKNWLWAVDDGFYSPYETQYQRKWNDKALCKLFYWLTDIPEFSNEVKRIFNERMSGKKTEMLNYFVQTASEIKDYALYNNIRHNLKNFVEEVYELGDWISNRFDHFEETYGNND